MNSESEFECPICMDTIGPINCMTTECGHKFHANCLMKNIDRNGFTCPCCRSQMVEECEDSDTEYDSDGTESDDSEWSETHDDEYALRGLRFFTNLLEGEEHDQRDLIDEYQDVDPLPGSDRKIPSVDFVAEKLKEQGATFEQLIAWIMIDHTDEITEEDRVNEKIIELEHFSGDMYDKIKTIIDGFNI